ncbi:MAG: MASE3 domain-containing protein [bacterium]
MKKKERSMFSSSASAQILGMALALSCLFLTAQHSYLLFHSAVELFAAIVAFSVFVIGWNSRSVQDNNYVVFIGVAYLFVGIAGVLHLLTYKGMGVFVNYNTDLATQLWIVARSIQAVSLLAAPFFINRKFRSRYLMIAYGTVFPLLLLSIFYWRNFPVCFVEGTGLTEFKIYSEYAICALLVAAIFSLRAKRAEFEDGVYKLITASIALTIITEVAFTFYAQVYDSINLFGHLVQIVSFYLIYQAIVVTGLANPYNLLFRNLIKSQEQYKQSELKYRSIFESAANVIILMDWRGTIIDCNGRLRQMTGFAPEDMAGLHIEKLIRHEQPGAVRAFLKDVLIIGDAADRNFKIIRKDGMDIDISIYCSYINGINPEDDRITCIIEDITDIKHMTRALTDAKEAAETASRTKSDFLANMSHELRTPLNAIIGFSEFLMKGYADELDPKHIDYISKIYTSGHHLLSLINDILDLSKIEAGKMNLYPEKVDLRGVLKYSATLLREKAMTHNIQLDIDVKDAPETITADLRKLKQIMFNLLSNALKFTPDGGRVGITARVSGSFAQITVWDTGIGITKDNLDKIFLPFVRDEKKEVQRIEGTGLGLSMVRRLVELHGGDVWAESEENKGSSFHFTMPIDLPETVQTENPNNLPRLT